MNRYTAAEGDHGVSCVLDHEREIAPVIAECGSFTDALTIARALNGGDRIRAAASEAEERELRQQLKGAVEAGEALADAVRALDSYAASSQVAPLERSERAAKALRAWDARGR